MDEGDYYRTTNDYRTREKCYIIYMHQFLLTRAISSSQYSEYYWPILWYLW